MKRIWGEIKDYSVTFKQHWLRYLLLFVGLDLFNQLVVIPAFRFVTTYILQAGAIPFISYQNVVTIITSHTLIVLALLIELLLLILIIYAQFAFLLVAVKNIELSFKQMMIQTWHAMKRIRLGSLFLLLAYFILIVPFADIIFRTPLLAKIQIPEFILDYMTRNIWLSLGLGLFYLIIFVLGIRWIFTLPLMVFKKSKTRFAIKKSWNLTKHGIWWKILSSLLAVGIITIVSSFVYFALLYLCQLGEDYLPWKLPFIFANINLFLIQFGSALMSAWSTVVAVFILFKPLHLEDKTPNIQKKKAVVITWSSILLISAFGIAIVNNQFYLKGDNLRIPVTISHRGVNNHNGVQNTIPALKKTAKLHPDYVEMDLHETKDNQFVVMHDENLAKLAGINKMPKDLTLKQLTKITIKEDGHKAKIASFDQYLRAAKKLNQKLLVEIKTTPRDSKKMLMRFNKKYGKLVLKRNYQVQSLDYRVVEGLHQINPKLFVLYIQPYNFTYPQSVADGYSMEYSTLNNDFIWQANLQNHPVYAWTVNDEKIMRKMMFEGVNGIITDNLSTLNKSIKTFKNNHSYASRLLNYIWVLPNPYSIE